jgi:hypothetical protein
MVVDCGEPLILYPDFVTVALKVPPLVKPLMGRVYVGPEPLRVPLITPDTPLKVISPTVRPSIDWLKVKVNCVEGCVDEPLAFRPLNVRLTV